MGVILFSPFELNEWKPDEIMENQHWMADNEAKSCFKEQYIMEELECRQDYDQC